MTSDFWDIEISLEELEEDLRFRETLNGRVERVVDRMGGYGGINEGSGVADSTTEEDGFL